MNTINYQSYLCTENNVFAPETSSDTNETRFPVKVFETYLPKYSVVPNAPLGLSQLDIRAEIHSITNLYNGTNVLTNSTKLLASDIQFGGIYYYYKHPILQQATIYWIDGTPTTNIDSNFIYLTDNSQHVFTYLDASGTILATEENATPLPVYICQSYLDLAPIYGLDNKTYSISLNNGFIEMKFNKPNVNVVSTDANIFDLTIYEDDIYPIVQYDPFYIVITEGSSTDVYDYSYINTSINADSYSYSNRFVLLGGLGGSIDESLYAYFDTMVGFPKTNSGRQIPVFSSFVDAINIYNPITDSSILFGSSSVSKNILQIEYQFDNNKPALYGYPDFFKTRIPVIDSTVYKYCEPQAYYLANNPMGITFPDVLGQDVKTLEPFCYIPVSQIDEYSFKFDISDYSNYIDTTNETIKASYIYDYTQMNVVQSYLNSYKPFTESVINYTLDTRNIRMFVSIDGKMFVPLELTKYQMSVDSNIKELTVEFTPGTIELYNYLTFGWLFGNTQLLSTEIISV